MKTKIKTEAPQGYVVLQRSEGKAEYAACLDGGKWHGWLFKKGAEVDQWVSERKLEEWEVMQAEDQRDDNIVHETVANKAEVEPTCVCGSPTTLGSVHRTDGPCYVAEATPPATTGASTAPVNSVALNLEAQLRAVVRQRDRKSVGASTVLTDERIEELFKAKGGRWQDGDYGGFWVIEDADLHPFVREVAAQAGQVAVPGWVSVEDRLPELQKEVLIFCGYLVLGYRTDDKHDPENHNGWVIDFDNGMASPITHWMPLPPSPAKESK